MYVDLSNIFSKALLNVIFPKLKTKPKTLAMDEIASIKTSEVKKDIYRGIAECTKRGLIHSAKWLAGMNHGLATTERISPSQCFQDTTFGIVDNEFDDYMLAKTFFDVQEYDRSAYFTQNCESAVPKFLHLYATYMSKEKKRLDNLTDTSHMNQTGKELGELLAVLKAKYSQRSMDAYLLYLYGVVLKKLDLNDLAITVLLESVHVEPVLWSSWVELVTLISDRDKLANLNLPNHWMKHIFIGHAYIDLFLNDEGLKIYDQLQKSGFVKNVYIQSQIAIAHHNNRNVEQALTIFRELQEIDPYRLDTLDTYSNLLFVKDLKREMAFLAHKAVEINKYRPETCTVIGNYYSIRAEHNKAVVYFQRALKLDPNYLSAWTLMGHEFMEMKNTNAAIQSYRKAVEVNRREYRAWYGLGQAYEILKMPYYSLYYYKMAQQFRPYDSRMLVALGEMYAKLDKNANALKCYQRACNVGDIEGTAMLRLADLYKSMDDIESAVPAYLSYCEDEKTIPDKASLCRAFKTLSNYYESINNHERATFFAYKCIEYDETKAEGLSLLKAIENCRASMPARAAERSPEGSEISMDESDVQFNYASMSTDP